MHPQTTLTHGLQRGVYKRGRSSNCKISAGKRFNHYLTITCSYSAEVVICGLNYTSTTVARRKTCRHHKGSKYDPSPSQKYSLQFNPSIGSVTTST